MERLCIYPKDIRIVTGKSERYGRDLIRKIKEALRKESHHYLTIQEFCSYTGLCYQAVKEKLKA